MIKKYTFAIIICLTLVFINNGFSQVGYSGNGNSGFGGPIGGASMTIDDNGTTLTFTLTKGSGGFNDTMVMYIANGENGRTFIDNTVNDTADANRRAISNTNSANLNFSSGFEVTHAVAINPGFGGLWGIPVTGPVGFNGLNFISAVGMPASSGAASFTFSFDWSQIGLTDCDKFDFVITYGNPNDGGSNMFSSDEAFGDGIGAGNPGFGGMTYTSHKSYPNVWTGNTDTDYNTATNWSEGLPNGNHTIYIPNTSNQPNSSTPITVKRVVVNSGSSLTAQNSLTANVTLKSISNSYSSLIVDGSVTGIINYKRHVNGNTSLGDTNAIGDNDLISPPLSGQTFLDFSNANSNLLANSLDANEKAFAPFDKTTGDYENYIIGMDDAETLDASVGYRAATNDTSTLTFTGTVNTGLVTNNIVNSGPIYADWNLIGNPYPSYLLVQDFLSHEVDSGEDPAIRNLDLLQPDTAYIFGYDGDVDSFVGYNIYNLANTTPSTVIAPGQGFLVSANPSTTPIDLITDYDIEFTPAMRTTGTSDDFIVGRGGAIINLELQIETASDQFVTNFYFNPNASLGLDPGYDAAFFGGSAPGFALYSHLVEENVGTPFLIQTLGDLDYGDTTIALGVNANQGEQLTFSISENTLPTTVAVYLDDLVDNTSTLLTSGDYVLTPITSINDTGRFYLRFADSALSTADPNFDNLAIYTNQNNRTIIISGQLLDETIAKVYDIQGRLVTTQQLSMDSTSQTIDASALNTGVYIVKLFDENQNKTEKIILK